jgi:hypothetical protein
LLLSVVIGCDTRIRRRTLPWRHALCRCGSGQDQKEKQSMRDSHRTPCGASKYIPLLKV